MNRDKCRSSGERRKIAPISASAGRIAASRRWPDTAAPATRTGRLTVERGRKTHDRVPPNARGAARGGEGRRHGHRGGGGEGGGRRGTKRRGKTWKSRAHLTRRWKFHAGKRPLQRSGGKAASTNIRNLSLPPRVRVLPRFSPRGFRTLLLSPRDFCITNEEGKSMLLGRTVLYK